MRVTSSQERTRDSFRAGDGSVQVLVALVNRLFHFDELGLPSLRRGAAAKSRSSPPA